MKKKKIKAKHKPTRVSRKETSHKDWLDGYWKWRKKNEQYTRSVG